MVIRVHPTKDQELLSRYLDAAAFAIDYKTPFNQYVEVNQAMSILQVDSPKVYLNSLRNLKVQMILLGERIFLHPEYLRKILRKQYLGLIARENRSVRRAASTLRIPLVQ